MALNKHFEAERQEEGEKSSNAVMEAKSFPMNGGDGAYSYTNNSQIQREGSNVAKELISEAIVKGFDITSLRLGSNTIRIADLGCSVGPNTFICMDNVIKAMERECQAHDLASELPEFQVFFSDHPSNDFNTLFTSLPPDRHYFAVGVPGSFYGRLFPKASLHFVHSSYALQWLSIVPKALLDKSLPSWNKGRIHYRSASEEVANAYAAQFAKDMENFLDARSAEIVVGGMMILTMPTLPDGTHYSQLPADVIYDLLSHSLMDMVKMGTISEADLDTFNLPLYTPCPKEMTELVERNGCLSIERVDFTGFKIKIDGPDLILHLRAGFEGIFTEHFGSKIIDELLDRATNKSVEISYSKGMQLSLVLKRK